MTVGLSYDGSVAGTTSYVGQISTMAVVEPTNTAFLAILPQMITYAENRIYRDLDLLVTQTTNSYTISGNNIDVPAASLVTVQNVVLADTSGNTYPLLPITRDFANNVYGNNTYTATPQYFFITGGAANEVTDYNIYIYPYPNASYTATVTGTFRPASLSATNLTTFISLYLPDLLIMASMIYVSAYQRNFGRANDDPQMAVSYESQYKTLLQGAMMEEYRKKFQASAWSSHGTSPVATPTR